MFLLVDAVLQKAEPLEPECRRLLEKMHRAYILNGLGIRNISDRKRFKDIAKRLGELSIAFQTSMVNESGGIWFTLEELHGVPGDVVSNAEKGVGDNDGKVNSTAGGPSL